MRIHLFLIDDIIINQNIINKINIISLNVRFVLKLNRFKYIYDIFQRYKMNILFI